jgi:hypothetical protein
MRSNSGPNTFLFRLPDIYYNGTSLAIVADQKLRRSSLSLGAFFDDCMHPFSPRTELSHKTTKMSQTKMCALNRFMSNLLAASSENAGHPVQVRIIEDNAQTMASPAIACTNISSHSSCQREQCHDDVVFEVKTPRFVMKLSAAAIPNLLTTTIDATKKSRSLHQENQRVQHPPASPIVVSHSRIVSSSYKSRNTQLRKTSSAEALVKLGQSWSSVDYTTTLRGGDRRSERPRQPSACNF